MSHTDPGTNERQASLRRLWNVIVREFIPQPVPRLRPTDEQLTDGHLAVGTIDDAIEESPAATSWDPTRSSSAPTYPGTESCIGRSRVRCRFPAADVASSGRLFLSATPPSTRDFVDDEHVVGCPPAVRLILFAICEARRGRVLEERGSCECRSPGSCAAARSRRTGEVRNPGTVAELMPRNEERSCSPGIHLRFRTTCDPDPVWRTATRCLCR